MFGLIQLSKHIKCLSWNGHERPQESTGPGSKTWTKREPCGSFHQSHGLVDPRPWLAALCTLGSPTRFTYSDNKEVHFVKNVTYKCHSKPVPGMLTLWKFTKLNIDVSTFCMYVIRQQKVKHRMKWVRQDHLEAKDSWQLNAVRQRNRKRNSIRTWPEQWTSSENELWVREECSIRVISVCNSFLALVIYLLFVQEHVLVPRKYTRRI